MHLFYSILFLPPLLISAEFQFTSSHYNASIFENARGKVFAAAGSEKMGVFVPHSQGSVKFKIVRGDRKNFFKATSRVIGNFAFLRIRIRPSLDVTLNRELRDTYNLLVKATFRRKGTRNLETRSEVTLRISDQNDLVPLFLPSEYKAELRDDAKPFTHVVQVFASDADEGLNGQVYYCLASPSEYFTIHPVTGRIDTIKRLDAAVQSEHSLTVQAEDRASRLDWNGPGRPLGPQIQTATVIVRVEKANLHNPAIHIRNDKDIKVSRSILTSQTAAVLSITDSDSGVHGEIGSVHLVPPDSSFRISEGKTPSLYLLQTIPGTPLPEAINYLNVTVFVQDKGVPPRNASKEVTVTVTDVQPSKLEFSQEQYLFGVNESAPEFTPLGFVAPNSKMARNSNLRFEIRDNTSPFGINAKTGLIFVSEPLDFEMEDKYLVTVRMVSGSRSAEVTVEVTVLDENDNGPEFDADFVDLEIEIEPDLGVESVIARVNAYDADSGDNARISYRIVNSEETPFLIDYWTGELKVHRVLTSESASWWDLQIRASDWGKPLRRETQTTVHIRFNSQPQRTNRRYKRQSQPQNHPPKFDKELYELEIAEDTSLDTVIGRITARDSDLGYDGLVQFVVLPNGNEESFFGIETYSGNVRIIRNLTDTRRRNNLYELTVLARDLSNQSASSTAKLEITVLDVNDHPPVFERLRYRVKVPEDARVPAGLLQLKATDEFDEGPNAKVGYYMVSRTNEFELNEQTGMLTVVKKLDREKIADYELEVRATDAGSPPLSATAHVFIEVVDVNDNPPKCLTRSQKVQVAEDWPQGALVTCMAASDPDEGENGRFTFGLDPALLSTDLPFRIEPDSGCVWIAPDARLDYETRPLYNLTIEVTDHGMPQYSSVCNLLIELIDVDENRFDPEFEDFAIEAAVYENSPSGTSVLTVTASDPDSAADVPNYAVHCAQAPGLFTMDALGTIRTTTILDRERQDHYWLTVTARDRANIPRSATLEVYVEVLDRNDHAPRPAQPIYFASVPENSPAETLVIRIEATDPDQGNSDGIRYRISRGDPQSFFKIDAKTGYITTHRRKLDRETQSEHELEVTVTDSGEPRLSTAVTVVVRVEDENDIGPEFDEKIYNFNVPEVGEGERNVLLCRVFASDADIGLNGELRYNITQAEHMDRFGIRPETGEIFAKSALYPDESFGLTVQVHDLGDPQMSSQTRVMLAVVPKPNKTVINHPPVLLSDEFTEFHISDSDTVGYVIDLLLANDPDGDPLWYQITEGNTEGLFSLQRDTGRLQLARRLDSVNETMFRLTYSVSDGVTSLYATMSIYVQRSVAPRPVFDYSIYEVSIKEKSQVGTIVVKLNAFPNWTENADQKLLTYSMHSADSPASADKFKVEARTGHIVLVQTLDHEQTREHRLTVAARYKQLVNYATVIVTVIDENDMEPKFSQKHYEAKVFETAVVGTEITQLVAVDLDTGLNGQLAYIIISGNEQGMWSLDAASGVLTVAKALSLDFPESVLVVRASDHGKPPRSDTCTVRLMVVISELSPPRFIRDTYTVSLPEHTSIGSLVTSVFAESFTGVRYGIATPIPPHFEVHPASGLIFLRAKLNYEYKKYHNFTVTATGSGGSVGTARVEVAVMDSNDHAPVFKEQIYEGTILENMPAGTVIMTSSTDGHPLVVSATDADRGSNALVNYEIIDTQAAKYFAVDYGTGAIRTRMPLDFEKTSIHQFEIRATDMGSPSLMSAVPALVKVIVRDTNDQPPVLVSPRKVLTVTLPTVKGVLITKMKAKDPDTVGELKFSIAHPEMRKLFQVDESSGEVKVAADDWKMLNKQRYELTVSVTDGVHTVSEHVEIVVQNISSSLRFRQELYSVSVVEEVTSVEPQTVLLLHTLGTEVGEHVTYKLLNPNPWFTLGSVSGELKSTGKALDRELSPNLTLVVQARDQRVPQRIAQALVTVAIQDVNDCAPKFVSLPYYAVIPLDAEVGDNVTKVQAIDLDEGDNGQIRYSIAKNIHTAGRAQFVIGSTDGRITVAESFPEGMQSTEYVLEVAATDLGIPPQKSLENVRIKVVNRAMPVFEKAFYSVEVAEDAKIDSVLLEIKAISNVGGTIGYSIFDGDPNSRFGLDYISGVLSVKRPLDRETWPKHNLTVRAVDIARSRVHADVSVILHVTDVNDNPPVFINRSMVVDVSEAMPVGSTVLDLLAQDEDMGDNAKIRYSLAGPDASVFEVNRESGQVYLVKPLDFETRASYKLTAIASDSGSPAPLSSQMQITVRVVDVNDNSPVFSSLSYAATIPDDVKSGHFVTMLTATDEDTVSSLGGERLLYSVLDGDVAPPIFELDRHKGMVTTARELELTEPLNRRMSLNISVTDGVFTSYSLLIVDILPSVSRSSPPTFEKTHFEAAVRENGLPQESVTTVKAYGGAPPLTFTFGGHGGPRPFNVNSKTGQVLTRAPLDYELHTSYQLPLVVRDAAGRQAFASLTVNVIDDNDNPPAFVAHRYSVAVNSNATQGHVILRFLAIDPDAGDRVEYSMHKDEESDELWKHFKLQKRKGQLSIRHSLTELEGRTLDFYVKAMDRGNPPRQQVAPVEIHIVGPDELVPKFSDELYQFSVLENVPIGFNVGQLSLKENIGPLHYSIIPALEEEDSLPFSIDSAGRVSTVEELDRETHPLYQFCVSASSIEDRTLGAIALVTIRLEDVNDNAPRFEANYEQLEISEDAPVGTSLTVISASDPDEGQNAELEFEIEGEDAYGMFKIDTQTGWLQLDGALDRETKDTYSLSIIVKDQGMPRQLSVSTQVTVTVTDSNDCAPVFGMDSYLLKVLESALPGTVIGHLDVSDADLPPNNATNLFIVGGNEDAHFGLRDSGELFLKRQLDYESRQKHELMVLASDSRHTGRATVVIDVQDDNDNAPVCETDLVRLILAENVEPGSEVFLLVADDPDSGKNAALSYKLAGNNSDHFEMAENGMLLVRSNLDRESQPEYDLSIKAVDIGGLWCETRVNIQLSDVNDCPPVFTQSVYEVDVRENVETEADFLIRVLANDPDLGAGGKVQYALLNEDEKILESFALDELTGALTVRTALDREERHFYNLTVMAMDQGTNAQLSASAQILIRVLDVNDNPPVFERTQYEANVSENEAIGFELLTLRAISSDAGQNAKIRYHLLAEENALDLFSIHEDIGLLTLAKELDFETQQKYQLRVEAVDSGEPPLSATVSLLISVLDANDNPPKFTQSLYEAQIAEDAIVGTEVLQVIAHDLDGGENGEVTYKLAIESESEVFEVGKDGKITLAAAVDREQNSQYRLLIEAWDKGQPPLTDSAAVAIKILDVNDNPPIFDNCNLTAAVQEDSPIGVELLTVSVTDLDTDAHSRPFRFELSGSGSHKFRIDLDGALRTNEKLKYSEAPLYLLTVTASDSGTPALSSECPLTVRVLEESKHAPVLKAVQTTVNAYLGEFPGGVVAKATATDRDPRDVIRYAIVPENGDELFTMDSWDGRLTASPGLPVGLHKLNISATDGKYTDYALFEIEVITISDDALEYAVSLRFKDVSPEAFVTDHKQKLSKSLAQLLNVRPKHVRVISVQQAKGDVITRRYKHRKKKYRHRAKRGQGSGDAEILFTVSKSKNSYYKPNFIRRRLDGRTDELGRDLGLEVVAMVTEVCRRDLCVRGDCRDRLTLDDISVLSIVTAEGWAFVAPGHERTYECICKDGYGGKLCNVAVNACNREPCSSAQICVPQETATGYECICPAGRSGDDCEESSCPEGKCNKAEALSFSGKSYVEYSLSTTLNRRLNLAIEVRTVASNGIIMHAAGNADYNILELRSGFVQYRFDCGSGEGLVRISDVSVADGHWHMIALNRKGRHAKLTLDNTFTAEGFAPGSNSVLNLHNNDLCFGAKVSPHATLYGHETIEHGLVGCLNRIFVDGFELPRSKTGMRLYNVNLECRDTFIGGVCSSQPCRNFGTCVPQTTDTFACLCHPRFTGRVCEIDLNPCASQPCLNHAKCENLLNDYFCKCTPGYTGKTCRDIGDFDECVSSPCIHGTCINVPGSFICNCTKGWSGATCAIDDNAPPDIVGNPWGITILEILIIVGVLILLALIAILIICFCKRRAYRYHKAPYQTNNNDIMLDQQPHIRNPLVSRTDFNKTESNPPPLPPRARGFHPHRNSKLSNLESAQQTGLPTIQVRPLSFADREGGSSPTASRRWLDECVVGQSSGMGNLENARNYGSAAEELEQLSRFSNELMQTFGKPMLSHRSAAADEQRNLHQSSSDSNGIVDPDDWMANLDLLTIDSIERLKAEANAADEQSAHQASGRDVQSMAASIQCLAEDDPSHDESEDPPVPSKPYHWDYTDWNSTLGQPAMSTSVQSSMPDDDNAPLPQGVSALEETDSEFVMEDDESSFAIPDLPPSPNFKKQLLALQRLTDRAHGGAPAAAAEVPSPPKKSSPEAQRAPTREDEYVTMKPVYQRYLPKHRTPPSTQSQRKPLLANDRSAASSDSEDADSCGAVVQYGFPDSKRRGKNVAAKLQLHTYDLPETAEEHATVSSFKQPLSAANSEGQLQASTDGNLSSSPPDPLSGICAIDDSDSESNRDSLLARQTCV